MTWQLTAAILSVAALFAMTYGVRKFGVSRGWSPETQRKAVHVGVGVHAMLLPLVMDRVGFAAFAVLALAALLILRIPRMATAGAGAAIHSVSRRSWGDVLFLISVTVLFLRSAGSMEYYTLPLAVLTMADAAAALIGTEYGRRHFGAGDRIKSVEGTVTFFVTTWIVSVTILILGTPVPRSNVIWLSTVIAAMAALIEADSWEGFDNVFIPLGVHSLMVTWGQSEPWLLGAISALWLGVLIETRRIAAPLRLTPHALRVTFIALFLSAGIVEPPNIVLPALAFVAHLAMRRFSDRGVAISDLDFVLVLVLLGIVWLAAGASSYHDATEFYTMTFAALAAGYAVLAVPSRRFHLRIATGIVASAIVLPAHQFLGEGMADGVRWMPRPVAITACAVTTAACVFVAVWNPPVLLRKSPGFKLAALAWALPAATFGVLLFR